MKTRCEWSSLYTCEIKREQLLTVPFVFPVDSLIGASLCISVPVCPLHHAMPSSGGRVGSPWCPPSADGSFVPRSSTSGGSSAACVASQQDASLESSESASSPWDASTRCSPLSGSISVRWFAGPSATRWDLRSERFRLWHRAHFCRWIMVIGASFDVSLFCSCTLLVYLFYFIYGGSLTSCPHFLAAPLLSLFLTFYWNLWIHLDKLWFRASFFCSAVCGRRTNGPDYPDPDAEGQRRTEGRLSGHGCDGQPSLPKPRISWWIGCPAGLWHPCHWAQPLTYPTGHRRR